MQTFLALITPTADGFAGLVPELTVLANEDTREALEQALREGIALALQDARDLQPVAQRLADLPAETQADYTGLDVTEVLLAPAEINPISVQIERAIERRGLSYREIARRMATGHAAISRMASPFYWGHSVATLRKLAQVLDLTLDMEFVTPVQLPSGSILGYSTGGTLAPEVRVKNIPEVHQLELPVTVKTELGVYRLHRKSNYQNSTETTLYSARQLG